MKKIFILEAICLTAYPIFLSTFVLLFGCPFILTCITSIDILTTMAPFLFGFFSLLFLWVIVLIIYNSGEENFYNDWYHKTIVLLVISFIFGIIASLKLFELSAELSASWVALFFCMTPWFLAAHVSYIIFKWRFNQPS